MRYANVDDAGALLGFYSTDVHGKAIPVSAVEITDEQWRAWLANPSGYRWAGTPATLTRAAPPDTTPTTASALAALRALSAAQQCAGVQFQPAGLTAAKLFATDLVSQVHLGAAYTRAMLSAVPGRTSYPAADGTLAVFTATEIQALALKAAGYVLDCANRAAELMLDIKTNPATDITQGWPSNA